MESPKGHVGEKASVRVRRMWVYHMTQPARHDGVSKGPCGWESVCEGDEDVSVPYDPTCKTWWSFQRATWVRKRLWGWREWRGLRRGLWWPVGRWTLFLTQKVLSIFKIYLVYIYKISREVQELAIVYRICRTLSILYFFTNMCMYIFYGICSVYTVHIQRWIRRTN